MEKSEFCVLIERYFLRGNTLSETKAKLDKYTGLQIMGLYLLLENERLFPG